MLAHEKTYRAFGQGVKVHVTRHRLLLVPSHCEIDRPHDQQACHFDIGHGLGVVVGIGTQHAGLKQLLQCGLPQGVISVLDPDDFLLVFSRQAAPVIQQDCNELASSAKNALAGWNGVDALDAARDIDSSTIPSISCIARIELCLFM